MCHPLLRHLLFTIVLASMPGCFGTETDGGDEEFTPCGVKNGPVCPDMIRIEPGRFLMGSPIGEGTAREHPQREVAIESAFWLDRTPVTNEAFVKFLRAKGNACWHDGITYECVECFEFSQHDLGFECETGTYAIRNQCQSVPGGSSTASCADHPVVLVTWAGARAYCEWRAKRLPSEAEWEYAANGSDADWQRFPWGNDCPQSWNSAGELSECAAPEWTADTALANCEDVQCHDGFAKTSPVGYFEAINAKTGSAERRPVDMVGNVLERVEDCYHPNYEGMPPPNSFAWMTDCDVLKKIARGSGYIDPGVALRSRARTDDIAVQAADPDVGFRCARSN